MDFKFFLLQSPQCHACNVMIMCQSSVLEAQPIFCTVPLVLHPKEPGYDDLEAQSLAEILLAKECLAVEQAGQR